MFQRLLVVTIGFACMSSVQAAELLPFQPKAAERLKEATAPLRNPVVNYNLQPVPPKRVPDLAVYSLVTNVRRKLLAAQCKFTSPVQQPPGSIRFKIKNGNQAQSCPPIGTEFIVLPTLSLHNWAELKIKTGEDSGSVLLPSGLSSGDKLSALTKYYDVEPTWLKQKTDAFKMKVRAAEEEKLKKFYSAATTKFFDAVKDADGSKALYYDALAGIAYKKWKENGE